MIITWQFYDMSLGVYTVDSYTLQLKYVSLTNDHCGQTEIVTRR